MIVVLIVSPVVVLLLAAGCPTWAGPIAFTSFDLPSFIIPGAIPVPSGINSSGEIVGFFATPQGQAYGFLRSLDGSTFTIIDQHRGTERTKQTTVSGINDNGKIVGDFSDNNGPTGCNCDPNFGEHGFVRSADGSSVKAIDVPGAFYTYAGGINARSQIAGSYTASGGTFGYILAADGHSFTTFNAPGAENTFPGGINDQGQVAGSATYAGTGGARGTDWAFIRSADGDLFSIFQVPGATFTAASGINDSGAVVGFYDGPTQDCPLDDGCGFLRDADGHFTTLMFPGSSHTEATGISNNGLIVGLYQDSSGQHGFLASTVPEPSTWLLLGSGLVGLVLWRRKRTA